MRRTHSPPAIDRKLVLSPSLVMQVFPYVRPGCKWLEQMPRRRPWLPLYDNVNMILRVLYLCYVWLPTNCHLAYRIGRIISMSSSTLVRWLRQCSPKWMWNCFGVGDRIIPQWEPWSGSWTMFGLLPHGLSLISMATTRSCIIGHRVFWHLPVL